MSAADTLVNSTIGALLDEDTYFDKTVALSRNGWPVPGMEGERLPYSLSGDWLVTLLMVACFLLLCYALNKGHRQFKRQLKEFFPERVRGNLFVENDPALRYLPFLFVQSVCVQGLLLYSLFQQPELSVYGHPSWLILADSLGLCVAVHLLKYLGYQGVNWLFFDPRSRERWMEIYSLVMAVQGLLLFLLACALVYLHLDLQFGRIGLLLIIIIAKIVLLYKSYSIFFGFSYGILLNFLYFCSLEMIPLLFLLKIMSETNLSWI